MQLFHRLFEMLEIEFLVEGLEGLGDEIVLKSLNADHEIFLELILSFHEGLLSPVHALDDVYLLSHGLL